MRKLLIVILLCGICCNLGLAKVITVVMSYQGGAIINIDDKQYRLRHGEKTPEGVVLINANTAGANVDDNGRVSHIPLGMAGGENQTPSLKNISDPKEGKIDQIKPELAEKRVKDKPYLTINRGAHGMYRSPGTINGRSVTWLIDTGATVVAFSSKKAKQLGISYLAGKRVEAQTASGTAKGYVVTLKKMSIGPIELKNVIAVVVEGDAPEDVLFGQSAMKHLHITQGNGVMRIQEK